MLKKKELTRLRFKMEHVKIISEKKNLLFKRKEAEVEIESHSSVKKSDAEKIIAQKFSTTEDCVAVKKIFGNFGSNIFYIVAFIYDSKEIKEQTEPKPKKAAAPTQ